MSKPIIAITVGHSSDPEEQHKAPRYALRKNYVDAVEAFGGTVIIVPPTTDMEAIAPFLDGWLIPGGDDIDPAHFGEDKHPEATLEDPARFPGEQRLLAALPKETPVLGICYGCQMLNVAHGGSVLQHVPDVVGHDEHRGGTLQTYGVQPETLLGTILQEPQAIGKSYHHQAAGRIGEGLRVNATHEDGTIEGVEATDGRWLVGVQWHPERTMENATSQRLFAAFVERARQRQALRRP